MAVVKWLLCSSLCAFLYRIGGKGKPFNTKYRDLGCPLIVYGYLLTMWHPINLLGWIMVLLAFGLTFGALTTYWDSLFGFDNFWFHGFMIGLACFTLFWAGIVWWPILIRTILLATLVGDWSQWIKNDDIEESGRGFFLCATIPILLFK